MRPVLLHATLIFTAFAFAADAPLTPAPLKGAGGVALAQAQGESTPPEAQVTFPPAEPPVVEPSEEGIGGAGLGEGDSGDVGTDEVETGEVGADQTGAADEVSAQVPAGFGGAEADLAQETPRQAQGGAQAQQQARQALQQLRAQQEALQQQQEALLGQQAATAERTEQLEAREAEQAASLEASQAARLQRIEGYGATADLLIQADTALVSGELDVADLLTAAGGRLDAIVVTAGEQGRGVEAQLAEGARVEVLRAIEALERRDVYPARLSLQDAGVLIGQARLVAREAQPTAAQ